MRPTLLLFLRRVRCIAITDASASLQPPGGAAGAGGTAGHAGGSPQSVAADASAGAPGGISQLMVRRELAGPGLIELRSGPDARDASRWLVVSDTFAPGAVRRLGLEVGETTVALAFVLSGGVPQQQPVFAFLRERGRGVPVSL
jgi:hypothetical protein